MISSAFKSSKSQPGTTSRNYSGRVGPGRSNSDYKAISVQLQLQLPAGTELGKNQKGDMIFCVVYTETCVSLRLVTTKSVWKYRTEWNFEKRISDSGPSKHAWILVYSSRIKFYSHPQNPGNVPCKLHEKPCKVHGFRCSLHTSRTCTYCFLIKNKKEKIT